MTSGGKLLSVVEELEDEPYFWQAKKPAERARRARVRAVIGFFTGLRLGYQEAGANCAFNNVPATPKIIPRPVKVLHP